MKSEHTGPIDYTHLSIGAIHILAGKIKEHVKLFIHVTDSWEQEREISKVEEIERDAIKTGNAEKLKEYFDKLFDLYFEKLFAKANEHMVTFLPPEEHEAASIKLTECAMKAQETRDLRSFDGYVSNITHITPAHKAAFKLNTAVVDREARETKQLAEDIKRSVTYARNLAKRLANLTSDRNQKNFILALADMEEKGVVDLPTLKVFEEKYIEKLKRDIRQANKSKKAIVSWTEQVETDIEPEEKEVKSDEVDAVRIIVSENEAEIEKLRKEAQQTERLYRMREKGKNLLQQMHPKMRSFCDQQLAMLMSKAQSTAARDETDDNERVAMAAVKKVEEYVEKSLPKVLEQEKAASDEYWADKIASLKGKIKHPELEALTEQLFEKNRQRELKRSETYMVDTFFTQEIIFVVNRAIRVQEGGSSESEKEFSDALDELKAIGSSIDNVPYDHISKLKKHIKEDVISQRVDLESAFGEKGSSDILSENYLHKMADISAGKLHPDAVSSVTKKLEEFEDDIHVEIQKAQARGMTLCTGSECLSRLAKYEPEDEEKRKQFEEAGENALRKVFSDPQLLQNHVRMLRYTLRAYLRIDMLAKDIPNPETKRALCESEREKVRDIFSIEGLKGLKDHVERLKVRTDALKSSLSKPEDVEPEQLVVERPEEKSLGEKYAWRKQSLLASQSFLSGSRSNSRLASTGKDVPLDMELKVLGNKSKKEKGR